jgi:hypothetical protein
MSIRRTCIRLLGLSVLAFAALQTSSVSAESLAPPCSTCFDEAICPDYALAQQACQQGCSQGSDPLLCYPVGNIDNHCGDTAEIICEGP